MFLVVVSVAKSCEPATSKRQVAVMLAGRWCNIVCGLPTQDESTAATDADTYTDRMLMLTQKPFWTNVLNVNAVVALTIVAFLVGFFS